MSLTNTAANVDYTPMATPGTLTFNTGDAVTNDPASSTFQCFTVPIANDNDVEGNENFILNLTNPTGFIVIDPSRSNSQATVVINDDDRKLKIFP